MARRRDPSPENQKTKATKNWQDWNRNCLPDRGTCGCPVHFYRHVVDVVEVEVPGQREKANQYSSNGYLLLGHTLPPLLHPHDTSKEGNDRSEGV